MFSESTDRSRNRISPYSPIYHREGSPGRIWFRDAYSPAGGKVGGLPIEVLPGTVICAGTILTTNIRLEAHVQINLDCTVGHDVIMGEFTTMAPGVHVSGWVHFGKRVYVGTGAVIINGTEECPFTIGEDVIIGAGACVTRSIPAGLTVAGIPAKALPTPKKEIEREKYEKNLSFSTPS